MDTVRYFAQIDAVGLPIGFYPSDVWPDPPADAVEIGAVAWAEFLGNPGARAWRGGQVVPYAPPPVPVVPPDCTSLPWWRSGLKFWLRDDGRGGKVRRFDDVDAAIRALETAQAADGSADVARQRAGMLAREQFEYANGALRGDLLRSAPAFGFTAAEADESLWRAEQVRKGDLSGVWPLPAS